MAVAQQLQRCCPRVTVITCRLCLLWSMDQEFQESWCFAQQPEARTKQSIEMRRIELLQHKLRVQHLLWHRHQLHQAAQYHVSFSSAHAVLIHPSLPRALPGHPIMELYQQISPISARGMTRVEQGRYTRSLLELAWQACSTLLLCSSWFVWATTIRW